MNFSKRIFTSNIRNFVHRTFGAHSHDSHHTSGGKFAHSEPHVPILYQRISNGLLITTYLWIFYRFKQDGALIFGFYKPWLEDHDDGFAEWDWDGDHSDEGGHH